MLCKYDGTLLEHFQQGHLLWRAVRTLFTSPCLMLGSVLGIHLEFSGAEETKQ